MNPIDLYFRTGSREDFLADLSALGLVLRLSEDVITTVDGVAVDFIGQLVETPAVMDFTTNPISEVTPPTLFEGNRASVRLTGHDALARAQAVAGAEMEHTTLIAPADLPTAQLCWSGGSTPWDGSAEVTPPPADPDDLPAAKARLLARLAQRRWEVETGGIDIGENRISTDRESISMISGALQLLGMSPEGTTLRWKAETGFVTLDLSQLQAVAMIVGQHVQACFARESDLADALAAAESPEVVTGIAAAIEAFSP